MSDTIEYKSKTYSLHKDSMQTGDIVLLAKDDMALRIHSYTLKAHSPVFCTMLLTVDMKQLPLIELSDNSSAALAVVLLAAEGRPFDADWNIGSEAVQFCIKYDCILVGRYILDMISDKITGAQLLEALVTASWLNAVHIGAALLMRGSETYYNPNVRQHWNIINHRHPLVSDGLFTQKDAKRFRPEWLFAMTRAESKARGEVLAGEVKYHETGFWAHMAFHFLNTLREAISSKPSRFLGAWYYQRRDQAKVYTLDIMAEFRGAP